MSKQIKIILSLLFLLKVLSVQGGGGGKCASANLFKCPTETCENGISFVTDCLDCDGHLSTDTKTDTCFDRKLLSSKGEDGTGNPTNDYLWRDIVGLIVWFCAAGVSMACGVGGGGIYVPLGILLLNFAPKPSSGLSQASIFGASVGGLILNLRNKHPCTTKLSRGANKDGTDKFESKEIEAPVNTEKEIYYNRPLIDYDMALFLSPMEMAGAVLGVLIQKILPNWLYLILAAIILGFTAYKTFTKFKTAREKERKQAVAADKEDESRDQDIPETNIDRTKEEVCGDDQLSVEDAKAKVEEFLKLDARQYPPEKLLGLLILWVGLVLLTFFKGGKGVDSLVGITCQSPWYGALIGIQFLWTFGFASFYGWKLLKITEAKQAVNYPFHDDDVKWDFAKTRFYAIFTFIAGVVAGLIGIGGGMVLGPLMLIMGIHPRVSSATTATMVVLTSSSVAVLFVTAGLVPWEYAVTFFFTCLVGAYIGKTRIDGYVKRTGRASLLIFLLATIIALATIGCVVIVLIRLAGNGWCFSGFNKFCDLSEDDDEEDRCFINDMLRL